MQDRTETSEYVKLARKVIESYVNGDGLPDLEGLPAELTGRKAGVFVSLKKKGELRGCIGTIQPTKSNIAEEITGNAISSATRDPRFPPVSPDELNDIQYSVDVLEEPEEIPDMSHLDPGIYGVIVRSGNRSGLLLPDLEGVNNAEEQVAIAKMKAGIRPAEPVSLMRFKVTRYR